MPNPSFAELEAAAGAVIEILKTIPEFSNSKIAVIGGLGICKYLRRYRATKDVDFLITIQGAPKVVIDKLLAMPSTPFQQRAQVFFYKGPNGKLIQSPYVPAAALPISAVRLDALPYISELDLLVFKINSCGLRSTSEKKSRDAKDALALAEDLSLKGPIVLSSLQKNAVLQGLDDMSQICGRDKSW